MNIPEDTIRAMLLGAKSALADDDVAHDAAVKARATQDELVLALTNSRASKATYIADLTRFLKQHPNTAPTPLPPPMPRKPPPMPPSARPRESYSPPSPRKKR